MRINPVFVCNKNDNGWKFEEVGALTSCYNNTIYIPLEHWYIYENDELLLSKYTVYRVAFSYKKMKKLKLKLDGNDVQLHEVVDLFIILDVHSKACCCIWHPILTEDMIEIVHSPPFWIDSFSDDISSQCLFNRLKANFMKMFYGNISIKSVPVLEHYHFKRLHV